MQSAVLPMILIWKGVVPLTRKQWFLLPGSLSVDVLKLLFAGPVCWMDPVPSCPGPWPGRQLPVGPACDAKSGRLTPDVTAHLHLAGAPSSQ